ncbi:MAG TPA: protein kinase, partial [Polyangiaceae bacterium]|nr:protein kinase [Polyangiaceae bacterium]
MATAITTQEELMAQAVAENKPPPRFAPQPASGYGPPPVPSRPPGASPTPPPAAASGIVSASVPPSSGQSYTPPPVAAYTPQLIPPPGSSVAMRADQGQARQRVGGGVLRTRSYAFVLDANGLPIEVGSGRFAKAYLGEERWLESKTDFRRHVVVKILQRGVAPDDALRFQMEKELLERVQGHPNVIRLYASGEGDDGEFIPASIRDQVEPEYMILEKLDLSLEERLKGSRVQGQKEDLLALPMHERMFRVLDYMIPIASAIEYAHLVRNICHRDIKPANVLVGLADPNLRGSVLEVRLADFNVAKLHDDDVNIGMTQLKSVPGTLFFQSPEQETNVIELLVNVVQGSAEVEFFEDFYIQIAKNDTF